MNTLIVGARIHGVDSRATSILFGPAGIEWIGSDDAAREMDVHVRIDGHGLVVTPGFVDSHVHATNTGLMMIGLDLTETTSAQEVLARVRIAASAHPGEPILGHGWDETRWHTPKLPTLADLDSAAAGEPVYLSRVDVHSALVSSALVSEEPDLRTLSGCAHGSPLVSQNAHGAARRRALGSITPDLRTRAQRAFLDQASRRGIVAVHEMAGPTISGESDARDLLRVSFDQPGPRVFLYWGELASSGGIDRARALGAVGAGGDLFLDGALGSRTAALHEPYSDDPDNRGALYVDFDDVVDHIVQCTIADVQAGFHVIGDRACDLVTDAFRISSERVGVAQIRRLRHRLEHAEMVSGSALATLTDLGVILSMQPLFDGLWSGTGGMYEQRLGRARAHTMNRWGSALRAGGTVAFSSDCPVTEMSPWAQVRAAMQHHDPDERISEDDAVHAHSRAGWCAIGDDAAGVIAPGRPAHLALWDPRNVDSDPACVATWVAGGCSYAQDGVT
ncbi:MAG: amidohydrolase family protein [Actinobacteria bacterium]|nr:amidohydrolase family protein [Actinomycetota bacterium]